MSRGTLFLLLLIALIVAGLFVLAGIDTEVAPTRIEKAVLNDAQAQ